MPEIGHQGRLNGEIRKPTLVPGLGQAMFQFFQGFRPVVEKRNMGAQLGRELNKIEASAVLLR